MLHDDSQGEASNPYASPKFPSVDDDVIEFDGFDSEQAKAFVGPRYHYYLERWKPVLRGTSNTAGFNWAAFFLSGFWIPYRKMYKFGFIFYTVIAVESLIEEAFFIGVMGMAEPPPVFGSAVGFAVAIICGTYGNRWYLSHTSRMMKEAKASGPQDGELLRMLAKRGGTSLISALGMFILFVAVMIVSLVFFDILIGEY